MSKVILAILCVVGLALGLAGAAQAETWTGTAGSGDLSWGNAANWGGDGLEEPETTPITFDLAGKAVSPGTITNVLDQDRILGAGLTVRYNHTTDLNGHTLTLTGTLTLHISGANLTFTNGTLKLGTDAAAANISATRAAVLTINSGFNAYKLGSVAVGGGSASGTLDLRGSTPASATFAAASLTLGSPDGAGNAGNIGVLYLNDTGGVINKLQVGNLYFGAGTITMKTGAAVTIGSQATPGVFRVGMGEHYGNTAVLTPTGAFTAYASELTVGKSAGHDAYGTLDLRSATISAFNVSGPAKIGGSDAFGKGLVYLRGGDVYFDSLALGYAGGKTGNLIRLEGTHLTVGNDDADTFGVVSGKGAIQMDYAYTGTMLSAFGNQVTLFTTMIGDGRITEENIPGGYTRKVVYDGTSGYTNLTYVPEPATLALLGLGGLGMLLSRKRK